MVKRNMNIKPLAQRPNKHFCTGGICVGDQGFLGTIWKADPSLYTEGIPALLSVAYLTAPLVSAIPPKNQDSRNGPQKAKRGEQITAGYLTCGSYTFWAMEAGRRDATYDHCPNESNYSQHQCAHPYDPDDFVTFAHCLPLSLMLPLWYTHGYELSIPFSTDSRPIGRAMEKEAQKE